MSTNLPDFDKAQYVVEPGVIAAPDELVGSSWDGHEGHDDFVRALVYGIGAAIVGCLLYAGFTIVTHIQIGYVAVGVGYLVGKAMLYATGGIGGRRYQIAAVVLTYLSVAMAEVPEILYSLHKRGMDLSHVSTRGMLTLTRFGLTSPFQGLTEGIGGLLGLFILFIGMRAAWSLTAGRPTA
jgi:hypothetical protein